MEDSLLLHSEGEVNTPRTILPAPYDLADAAVLHIRRAQIAYLQGDTRTALGAYYDAQRKLDEMARALRATIPATPEAKNT